MPITVGHEDPAALGTYALHAGLGQYAQAQQLQALREQEMALAERQFTEQQEQNDFRNQFAVAQAQADQYNRNRALNLDFLNNQQSIGLRRDALAQEAATRAGYNQTQLAEAAMRAESQQQQQQMLMAREQAQIMAQADRQRLQETARRAAADWEAIQKARADGKTFLNESEYQQAVERWSQLYGSMGDRMPLPYVEEPGQGPLANFFSKFLGEDASMLFDSSSGDPLIDPQQIIQLAQIKQQWEQADKKAQIEQEKAERDAATKLEVERAKASQKQQQEIDSWRDSYIQSESESEAKRQLAMNFAGKDGDGKSLAMSREQAWLEYPPPVVSNKQQYDSIPQDMAYMDLDGKIWVKGREHQGPRN